jgi:hypothetical protein
MLTLFLVKEKLKTRDISNYSNYPVEIEVGG